MSRIELTLHFARRSSFWDEICVQQTCKSSCQHSTMKTKQLTKLQLYLVLNVIQGMIKCLKFYRLDLLDLSVHHFHVSHSDFYLHKFSGLRLDVSHKTIELFWLNAHMTKSRVVYWSHFVTAVIFLTNESSLCIPNAVMPLCLHSKEWVLMIAKQFCSMDQYFLFV